VSEKCEKMSRIFRMAPYVNTHSLKSSLERDIKKVWAFQKQDFEVC